MQKSSLKETILQWLVPIFILLALIIIIVINFAVSMKGTINYLYETNNKQVGKSYSENIESDLAAITSISDMMQNMLESRGGTNIVYLMDTVDVMVNSSDAYMVAYCWENGDAVLPNRVSGNLKDTLYFDCLQGTDNFFAYTPDDGVNGREAFLYVCPIEWLGCVNGYLITYIDPAVLENVFEEAHYGTNAYYAIVNGGGDVLATYGKVNNSALLQPDFWNQLKPIAESAGHFSVFEKQRGAGGIGVLNVLAENENRVIYSFPLNVADWNLVVCLDDAYVSSSFDSIWDPVVSLLIKVGLSIALFLIIIIGVNIASRIKAAEHNKKLKNEADTDLLTGLSNKIATERMIKEYMAEKHKKQGVFLIIDVDNFKKINDTMGHAFGDEVLRELSMRLQSLFRVTDIIGRVGGDEFVVFLKDIKDMEAVEREGRKLEVFFHQFEVGKYVKYSITASIGGAVFPSEGATFEDLYKAADKALYVSKRQGKNRLTFYHQTK